MKCRVPMSARKAGIWSPALPHSSRSGDNCEAATGSISTNVRVIGLPFWDGERLKKYQKTAGAVRRHQDPTELAVAYISPHHHFNLVLHLNTRNISRRAAQLR
ncbi:MAG: hypothetical protein VYA17_12180 [Pseudomonadota bacterium]|nr:hypothetical protein [Pseudomonadota bacterium]